MFVVYVFAHGGTHACYMISCVLEEVTGALKFNSCRLFDDLHANGVCVVPVNVCLYALWIYTCPCVCECACVL